MPTSLLGCEQSIGQAFAALLQISSDMRITEYPQVERIADGSFLSLNKMSHNSPYVA